MNRKSSTTLTISAVAFIAALLIDLYLILVYPSMIQVIIAVSLIVVVDTYFLVDVIEALNLNEISAVHGRAEEGARDKEMREKYDFVVSRAVANMAVLSEYCIPFVKVGGCFIPYKTGTVEEEITQGKKAIQILGGKIEKVEKLMLPDSDISRSFVFIRKEKQTPKAYPRKAGTASKQPLG